MNSFLSPNSTDPELFFKHISFLITENLNIAYNYGIKAKMEVIDLYI
jgi:hypothetical protein